MANHDGGDDRPERLAWGSGAAGVDARSRYLLVREEGLLADVADIDRFHRWLDRWIDELGAKRVLLDARSSARAAVSAIRARCAWTTRRARVLQVAIVLGDDARVVELRAHMGEERTRLRAFSDLTMAHRWLCMRTDSFPGLEAAPTVRLRPLRPSETRER